MIWCHYSAWGSNRNSADRSSSWRDCYGGYKCPSVWYLVILSATSMEPFNHHQPAIQAVKDTDPLLTHMQNQIGYPNLVKIGGEEASTDRHTDRHRKIIVWALTCEGRVYVPEAPCNQMISIWHENLESSHIGAPTSTELVSTDSDWLRQDTTPWKYVASYVVYHGINHPSTENVELWWRCHHHTTTRTDLKCSLSLTDKNEPSRNT